MSTKYKLIIVFIFLIFFYLLLNKNVGGDDSRLYMLYPQLWFNNITLSGWFGYLGGYNPQYFYTSYYFFTKPFQMFFLDINFQVVLFSTLILVSICSIYFLLKEFFVFFEIVETKTINIISILGSVFYSFSPLLSFTVWWNPTSSFVLIAGFPLLLYFYFLGLNRYKYLYAIIGGFLSLFFSVGFASVPVFLGGVLVFFIFFITCLFLMKFKNKRFLFKYTSLFIGLILLVNLFWGLSFVNSLFTSNPSSASTLSSSGKSSAVYTINAIARQMSTVNSLQNLPSHDLFSSNLYIGYNYSIAFLSYIYIAVILLGIYYVFFKKTSFLKIYLGLSFVFIFALYLQNVNFGILGIKLFSFLIEHVPGWVMFRNFFNKFTIPFVLIYAIFLSFNLYIISQNVSKKYFKYLMIALFLVTLLQSYPFLSGQIGKVYHYKPVSKLDKFRTTDVTIPSYFFEMTKYLKEQNSNSRVLSFPMSYASWSLLEDQVDNDIYIGLSPITVFTGLDDFNGKFGFDRAEQSIPGITRDFQIALYSGDKEKFKKILNLLDMEYIVINKTIYKDEYRDVFKRFAWGLDDFQTLDNINKTLDDKEFKVIRTFGPNESLVLVQYMGNVGQVYASSNLIELKNADVQDIWDLPFYSKTSAIVDELALESKQIPKTLIDIKVVKANRKYESLQLKYWNRGWVLPSKVRNPKTLMYKLMRLKEDFEIKNETEISFKIDKLLWNSSKRLEEYNLYGGEGLLKDYDANYNEIISLFNSNYDENNEDVKDMLNKVLLYTVKAKNIYSKVPYVVSSYNKFISSYDLHISYSCEYSFCFDFPDLDSNVDYSVLLTRNGKILDKKDYNYTYYIGDKKISSLPEYINKNSINSYNLKFNFDNLLDENNWIHSGVIETRKGNNLIVNAINSYVGGSIIKMQPIKIDSIQGYNFKYDIDVKGGNIGVFVFAEVKNNGKIKYENIYTKSIDTEKGYIGISNSVYIEPTLNGAVYYVGLYVNSSNATYSINELSFQKVDDLNILLVNKTNKDNRVSIVPTIKKSNIEEYTYNLNNLKTNGFLLVFKESFDKGWKVSSLVDSNKLQRFFKYYFTKESVVSESKHIVVNGYANAWVVNNYNDNQVLIEFVPRYLFYIGSIVSMLSVFIALIYFIYYFIKHKFRKKLN